LIRDGRQARRQRTSPRSSAPGPASNAARSFERDPELEATQAAAGPRVQPPAASVQLVSDAAA